MNFLIATSNLDFGRDPSRHKIDLHEIAEKKPDFIAVQECVIKVGLKEYHCFQPDNAQGVGSEAVYVRKGIKVTNFGKRDCAALSFGHEIGDRKFVWVNAVTDLGIVKFVSVHMPPERMEGLLTEAYTNNLRRLVQQATVPTILAGDFNCHEGEGIVQEFTRRWRYDFRGTRIDFIAIPRGLQRYAVRSWEVLDPNRADGHPVVWTSVKKHQ